MTMGLPRLAPRSADVLTQEGAAARLRVADTSDRFVRHFVDAWIVLGAAFWLGLYLTAPATQYPGMLMVAAGVLAKGTVLFGRTALARYLIVSLWTVFVLFVPMLLNGVRTPLLLIVAPLLMMTGWLLGRRVLVALTALFMCGVVLYWLAETRGWLVLTVPLRPPGVWAVVHMVVIGFTGFMVWFFVASHEANYGIEMDLQNRLAAALGRAEKANQELAAVLRFNETIVQCSPVPIGVYAADGRCMEANEAYARMVGTSRARLMSYNFHQIDKWRESGLLDQALASLEDGQPRRLEGAVLTAFGRAISGECHIMVTELNGERHLLVQFLDLTERHEMEERLRDALEASQRVQQELRDARGAAESVNRELRSVLKFNASILLNSPLPMRVFAADGRCIEANDAFARLIGVTREQLLAQGAYETSRWHVAALVDDCRQALATNSVQRREVQVGTSQGRDIWLESRIVPVEAEGGSHLLAQFVDMTERRRLEQELRMMAFYDALTQLPNRRLLLDRLKQAILVSQRHTSYAAILFMDLNKFKQLNDTHGHDAGDQLLVKVARRLRALVRQADTVARLGGDEFVVLIEELGGDAVAAHHHVEALAEKISRILNQEYQLGELHYSCTISIGWRLFCGGQSDPDEILKHADSAMYLAKRNAA
ncbi:MAG TPA: sensor domain-containing diguanylate cyclase [Burkholderiaceae bacterium]|nr:sensor domain-containing diguanylate cyclase [Burkholderiaceae bacterium]